MSVLGAYSINSNTSSRYTTEPGVTARFSPTSKASSSTVAGRPGKSLRKRRRPRTRLAPPSSTIALSTVGLVSAKLLGASASRTFCAGEARVALRAPVDVGVVDQAVDGGVDRQVSL